MFMLDVTSLSVDSFEYIWAIAVSSLILLLEWFGLWLADTCRMYLFVAFNSAISFQG